MIEWDSIRQQCVQTGEIIKVPKGEALPLPSYFHSTNLGLSKGAIRQYRDERPTNSLHIHEFPDCFLVHVDTFNPEFHPVAHGVVDTPGITLAILAGAVATFCLIKTMRNMSFLPPEREAKV